MKSKPGAELSEQLTNLLGGLAIGAGLCGGLQCQNNCMIAHWQKHDTPRWKHAEKICKGKGAKTFECCEAKVFAEQTGYTSCAKQCGVTGAMLSQIPYESRIAFGIDTLKCCGDRPQKGKH